MLQQNLP